MQLTILILVAILSSPFTFAAKLEDSLLKPNLLTPVELLKKEYFRSQALFMGFANHFHHQHIDQLISLLDHVGTDPELKYIVLERSSDLSDFYEYLSLHELDETLKKYPFADADQEKMLLCFGEWAYAINYLFPKIREINKLRLRNNPILVKTIDAIQSWMDPDFWPAGPKEKIEGSCSVSDTSYRPSFGGTDNRELQIAQNFKSEIWDKMAPTDKVIVLYNRGHLMDTFKSCNWHMLSPELWESRYSYLSWLGFLTADVIPGIRSKISLILMDEIFGKSNQYVTFKFGQNNLNQNQGKDWGTQLSIFQGRLPDTGLDMFTVESDFQSRISHKATSLSLPEIADGYILNTKAHVLFKVKNGADYKITAKYCQ